MSVHRIKCEYCGTEKSTYNKNQRFCSFTCAGRARHFRMKNKQPEPSGTRICGFCGKRYEKRYIGAFCSRECHVASRQLGGEPAFKRRCHDCGTPTSDYRCSSCRATWKAKHHVSGADDYSLDYATPFAGQSPLR